MNGWRAAITEEPFGFTLEIRLARKDSEALMAAIDANNGTVIYQDIPEGVEIPPLMRLPREAVEALRDALNQHSPPSSDADLREALTVERERVDHVLHTLLGGTS